MIVKQCSPLAGYLELKSGIDSAVMRVLSGGAYILGREVAAFEEEFDVEIPDTDAEKIKTVQDVIDYIESK